MMQKAKEELKIVEATIKKDIQKLFDY